MAKHQFSTAERYAVFKTHGDRCYICKEPIDMATFQVDHVVPESLLEDAPRLSEVLADLGRPATFEINSFENWLPACSGCNNSKRARPWDPSLLAQAALQQAADRADSARKAAVEVVSTQKLGAALTTLQRVVEGGVLTDDMKMVLTPLVEDYAAGRAPESDSTEVRLTPAYTAPLYEVLDDAGAVRTVRGPYGIGGGPSDTHREVAPAMRCGVCGYPYFSGARCVICGNMDDGD